MTSKIDWDKRGEGLIILFFLHTEKALKDQIIEEEQIY